MGADTSRGGKYFVRGLQLGGQNPCQVFGISELDLRMQAEEVGV